MCTDTFLLCPPCDKQFHNSARVRLWLASMILRVFSNGNDAMIEISRHTDGLAAHTAVKPSSRRSVLCWACPMAVRHPQPALPASCNRAACRQLPLGSTGFATCVALTSSNSAATGSHGCHFCLTAEMMNRNVSFSENPVRAQKRKMLGNLSTDAICTTRCP